jgi:aryl-alcohol dehydrogenase (NADP+)
MEYVNLGRSGLKVSKLCLGTLTFGDRGWRDWLMDEEASRPIIRHALEAGINYIDTADMYSSGVTEEFVGRALADFARRDEVVVTSKLWYPIGEGPNARGLSRKHVMDAIDGTLRRLGMDYVDVYMIHRYDPETPIEETLDALDAVVRAGKARYLGASSMFAWQFARMLAAQDARGLSRFIVMQNHYNLIYREEEREMIPLCLAEGVGLTPWSPIARGYLAGNRHRQGGGDTKRAREDDYAQSLYFQDADFAVADRNVEVAHKLGVKPAQLALAWLWHKPGVVAPVLGVSRQEQLDDGLAAMDIDLTPEDVVALEEPYVPHPVLGHT